jgi:non-ribosomal peptide synthetase-like protein
MIARGPELPDLLRAECLADIFRATVGRQPAAVAVEDGQVVLTYLELLERAEGVACGLRRLGVGPGHCVGLWLPRGHELIVGQVGIALAGAAWLPFDAAVPPDRLATCMRDARGTYVLTSSTLQAEVSARGLTPVVLKDLPRVGDGVSTRAAPEDVAYVIYTSGSTGEPKGIAISQRNVCHFVRSENAVLRIRADDRVYQGFSVAFDMSVEEIWISFLAGATLWVAPVEVVSDPDAVAAALAAQRLTVLHAVPTLVALMPALPATLRLLNLGGEACPDALSERLTGKGYQVFNTYGPTETTVTATLAELRPGQPVTIGRPLPNYAIGICDPERRLLPAGESGEIVVFGPGLANGYLGREELTAAKFVCIDGQRAYLTGDLGRLAPDGDIHCFGRVDNQVKLRGFRIELDEISAALADQPGVGTAAAVVRSFAGSDEIVAFIVASGAAPSVPDLREALARRLAVYMLPAHIEVLESMPRLSSGKVDMGALRRRELQVAASAASPAAADEHEAALRAVLAEFFPGRRLAPEVDFFSDLNGHSLLAARLVTRLRRDPRYAGIGVQHVYRHRQIGALAQAMATLGAATTSGGLPAHEAAPLARRFWCGCAQAACLPFLVLLHMFQWLAPFFAYHLLTGDAEDSMAVAILAALATYLAALALSFPLGIVLRRTLVGKLRPGNYPLWGVTYFRWWLGARLNEIPAVYLISGTPWKSLHLRLLGARVGRGCLINSVTVSVPELLTIGDGACLGTFVNLENARVEGGRLIIGRIVIGRGAAVDSYAVLENDTSVGDGARLAGQSALAESKHIPAGETWAGAPARPIARDDEAPAPPPTPGLWVRYGRCLAFAFGAALVAVLFYVPVFPSFVAIDYIDAHWLDLFESERAWWETFPIFFLLAIPAAAILLVVTGCLAGLLRECLPRQRTGRFSWYSGAFFWKWQLSAILDASLQVLHGLYASVYVGTWLRMLGTKVGRDAEVSTAEGVVPELLELGDESFIADGAMLGDEEQRGGWMVLRRTRIGARSFVGNGAYVPDGTTFPPDFLLGVQSSSPRNEQMQAGQTWMGSPPMLLPARETIAEQDPALTFRPSWARRLARACIEGLRIVVPLAFVIAVGYVTVYETMDYLTDEDWAGFALALTCAGFLYAAVAFTFVWAMKWLLVGRYRPRLAPMWTLFVWLSEAVTILHESLAVPAVLNYLRGTPMLPWALRLLGAKIGPGTWINTTDLTEFDCVSIGAGAELNEHSGPQTHLFEDRVMRIGLVKVGARATLGVRATVLYDASVGDDCLLGPLTLVAKGEQTPAGTSWEGTPSAPAPRS